MYGFILFILKIYYIFSSSIITLPFKRIFDNETNINISFHDLFFDNIIYTKISIGTPKRELFFQIKSNQYTFCVRNDSYIYMNSSTYKYNDKNEIDVYNRDFRFSIKSNESFILGKENILINDLKYMLTKESKFKYDGILGLQILDNNGKVWGYNLIPQLKEKSLINKECFFYDFEKNLDGELIIGEYPHLIDKYKTKFHEEQFQVTSVFIPSYDQNFDFKFRSVFWNGTELESLTFAHIEVELGMIKGSMNFCEISWDFFSPHFRKGKCKFTDVHVLYQSYVCDDYEDFDITKFPSIQFYINDADYNFELTYEDIFVKKEGKVYFMICFKKMGFDVTWDLGNLFLKRNMLIFDMDRKIMGFYNRNINYKTSSNSSNKNKIILLIIIIIIATLVIIGLVAFIIINFINKKRPKKAYELNEGEDYDYSSNILKAEINE